MRGWFGVLVVCLLAAGVAVAYARPHGQAGAYHGGRIAVIVGESGDIGPTPRLVVMDADGQNARVRLGWVYSASFSPDGRSIAYADLGLHGPEIWSVAVDGPGSSRRLACDGRDVDWSPLGDAIAFVRPLHSGDGGELWVENLQTRVQRRVVRSARVSLFTPDWTPDGKKLAFDRGGDVWVVDVTSKRAERLIVDATEPRWSPDGNRIAFVRDVGGGESFVFVARADGAAPRRVAAGDGAAWAPDGTELAIADFWRVTRIRPDGTHRRVIYAPEPRGNCPACRDPDWVR